MALEYQALEAPMASVTSAAIPTLLSKSGIGVYDRDAINGTVCGDAVLAEIFDMDVQELAAGVTLDRFRAAIHPDDRRLFDERQAAIDLHGGLVLAEYRTVARSGMVRWLLVRGYYEPKGADRIAPGSGIAIDITEGCFGRPEARPYMIVENASLHPLERAADLAMAMRAELLKLGATRETDLCMATDTILFLLGRALADLSRRGK